MMIDQGIATFTADGKGVVSNKNSSSPDARERDREAARPYEWLVNVQVLAMVTKDIEDGFEGSSKEYCSLTDNVELGRGRLH